MAEDARFEDNDHQKHQNLSAWMKKLTLHLTIIVITLRDSVTWLPYQLHHCDHQATSPKGLPMCFEEAACVDSNNLRRGCSQIESQVGGYPTCFEAAFVTEIDAGEKYEFDGTAVGLPGHPSVPPVVGVQVSLSSIVTGYYLFSENNEGKVMKKKSSLCDQIFESMMLMSLLIGYFIEHELETRVQRESAGQSHCLMR
ncbi:Transmembrane Emp24 Domain-Containing Protein 5 [Manis pentadactyla]|nr:Transmembrane Emp24 Domain-Containing Protein 5 [Manis pentadactyla]